MLLERQAHYSTVTSTHPYMLTHEVLVPSSSCEVSSPLFLMPNTPEHVYIHLDMHVHINTLTHEVLVPPSNCEVLPIVPHAKPYDITCIHIHLNTYTYTYICMCTYIHLRMRYCSAEHL